MILNSLYFLNQSRESIDSFLTTFKRKKKAPELAETKPKDILPFIYKPEGTQAKADSGPCLRSPTKWQQRLIHW